MEIYTLYFAGFLFTKHLSLSFHFNCNNVCNVIFPPFSHSFHFTLTIFFSSIFIYFTLIKYTYLKYACMNVYYKKESVARTVSALGVSFLLLSESKTFFLLRSVLERRKLVFPWKLIFTLYSMFTTIHIVSRQHYYYSRKKLSFQHFLLTVSIFLGNICFYAFTDIPNF